MKTISKHLSSALLAGLFIFIAFGSDENQSSDNNSETTTNETQVENIAETNNNENEIVNAEDSIASENQTSYLINDGVYKGVTTCVCCGENANKPSKPYEITFRNLSNNKISSNYLLHLNREFIFNVVNGEIVIDERNSNIEGLVFLGKIQVKDNRSFDILIQWTDSTSPTPDKILNECTGTFVYERELQ